MTLGVGMYEQLLTVSSVGPFARRSGPAILICGLSLLAGCSSSTATARACGILTGGIYNCGGPSDSGCPGVIVSGKAAKPISGTIVVSIAGHSVATAHLGYGESYRIILQPGTYTVSSGGSASRVRAAVVAGKTTTANVVNQIP
jgi:hypothetical protein